MALSRGTDTLPITSENPDREPILNVEREEGDSSVGDKIAINGDSARIVKMVGVSKQPNSMPSIGEGPAKTQGESDDCIPNVSSTRGAAPKIAAPLQYGKQPQTVEALREVCD
jgi:hypothetical protein